MRTAPPPLCKLSTPQISLHGCKGMISTYERICVDDLCGMIRQENRFIVLISDHERAEVLARIVTVLFADCQEGLVHIVRVRDADIFYVLDPNEVVEIQRIHADELEIQLGHVEHVVNVVKSQDELISGPVLDVQLPSRHLSRIKRVSWFFRDQKAFLSG